ncbi:MAG: hypothetical protein AAFV53_35695, partial [Myxococcota bacterium]
MLLVAIFGLLIGPLSLSLGLRGHTWEDILDGLTLSLVGGLSLLHLLPHAIDHAGLLAVGIAAVAMLIPGVLSRVGLGSSGVWGVLALALLAAHAALDGAALAFGHAATPALGLAVAAHRIPVGLMVFAAAPRPAIGWMAIGALVLSTGAGFLGGGLLLSEEHSVFSAVLEALVAGALLHIVFDGVRDDIDHVHGGEEKDAAGRRWSTLGALTGFGLIIAFTALSGDHHAIEHINEIAHTFGLLALESAPALLLGYVLAGLVSGLLPKRR